MRLKICQLSFILLFSSCDSTPADITGCVGSDVNIPWEYPDSAGMSTVFWEYIDSSNASTVILAQASGSDALVQNNYNIQHNTNGDVKILNATVANDGTFRISVTYSSATQPYTDDVVVNVYDPPTDFSFTGTPSGSQTTFTCTASSLGDPADDLYIQVNGVDMTSSVSATVPKTDTVKCILSGSSVQCMNGVSGTVTSLCVQCPTKPPDDCKWWKPRCWECWQIVVIIIICLLVLILIGVILGCFLTKTTCCCECFYKGKSCRKCVNNYYCECRCCDKTPCGALCNIKGLPYWYQVLWATILGSAVAFGIWLVWRCCNNGKSDKDDTSRNVESTRSSPEKAKSKLLNEKKQSSASGKTDGGNKGQHVSDTQPHPNDKSQKVHQEKEGRRLPSPPPGAILNLSQLPNIHDKKGRGLSANFTDEHHPLANIDIPAKKAGALDSIPDSAREEVKKKKKRSKKSTKAEDDDQND